MIILNFHGVGGISRKIDDGERDCWLEKNSFEAILDTVRGYPNVRLTVDDGNASDFEVTLPALLQRDLRATFFVCSGRLDNATFLSRAQLCELLASGMDIGSHGVAHVPWCELSQAQLCDELERSRADLENVCAIPIQAAACPFGSYNGAVLRSLKRAGYRSVYTSDGGAAAEDDWLKPRTTVTRSMALADVERLARHGPGALKQLLIDVRKTLKRVS